MKSVLASILAATMLIASLAWAGEAYCDTAPLGSGNVAASVQDDPASPDAQSHIGHHCGHLAQHLLGEPVADMSFLGEPASVKFEALLVPHLASLIDTPIRPPRTSLS